MPKANLEAELKFGLSRTEFGKLLNVSKRRSKKKQLNTYFDTSDLGLKRRGAGLRVRIEDGKRAFLTLKCAVKNTEARAKRGRHERREWECRLPVGQARRLVTRRLELGTLSTPVHRHLDDLLKGAAARVRIVGTVRTERTLIRIGRFTGELDAWRVGSQKFYELEVETAALGAAEKAVRTRFSELGIQVRPRAGTKLAAVFANAKLKRTRRRLLDWKSRQPLQS